MERYIKLSSIYILSVVVKKGLIRRDIIYQTLLIILTEDIFLRKEPVI